MPNAIGESPTTGSLLTPLCLSPLPAWPLSDGNKRQITPACIARFETKLAVVGDCWVWNSYLTTDGYGGFQICDDKVRAHRFAYFVTRGPIPDGLVLDHQCHNRDTSCLGGDSCLHRRCVNPAHLELATARENTLRGKSIQAANAAKTHCDNGHPFDAANTRVTAVGHRVCRACQRATVARYAARKRAAVNPAARRLS